MCRQMRAGPQGTGQSTALHGRHPLGSAAPSGLLSLLTSLYLSVEHPPPLLTPGCICPGVPGCDLRRACSEDCGAAGEACRVHREPQQLLKGAFLGLPRTFCLLVFSFLPRPCPTSLSDQHS